MGFDIYISISFMMCPETGKPYVFRKGAKGHLERSYDLPVLEVPTHLRKYLVGRGHLFSAYTEDLEAEGMGFSVSVDQFLENLPTWERVQESIYYRDDEPDAWNEDDHNGFKDLLEWCMDQELGFTVSWSY